MQDSLWRINLNEKSPALKFHEPISLLRKFLSRTHMYLTLSLALFVSPPLSLSLLSPNSLDD